MKTSAGKSNSGSSMPNLSERPRYSPYLEPGYGETAKYKAVHIDSDQRQLRGARMKRSKRWLECAPSFDWKPFPLISRLGKRTGLTMFWWKCSLPDWVASVTSTVSNRILSYISRFKTNRDIMSSYRSVILKAAGYYVLTNNSYFMDRLLFCCRNLRLRGKLIHKILLHFLSKMDANKRFVYSQVSYQTNWLLFRAASRPRDKSKFKYKDSSHLSNFDIGTRERNESIAGMCGTAGAIMSAIACTTQ